MKKKFLTFIFTLTAMLMCIFGFSACNKVEFKVNFVVDGAVYATLNTNGEEIIRMPENPTKEDYIFDGWYWDKDTWQTPFTANSLLDAPLSSDMNVYCKWKADTINVESVNLDKTELSLHEGDIAYLTATILPTNATDTSVVWESSNATIATVTGGKVTAIRIGSATITATTSDGGKIATCNVYVEPITVESVSLNHTALSLLRGESKTLTATVSPSNATEKGVLWHSANSSIVTVENGTVKAVGYGTATITATTIDGEKTAICVVEVLEDKITFNTLTVDDETVYGKVSNDTTTFSFIREIVEHGNATYQVYKEITCETLIASKSISLNIGDNTVYVLQTVGKNLKLYTVTVRRRPMYDVTFNANGGTAVEKQVVEEDYLATEPETTRTGYTFAGWDYDFSKPITKNTTVTASWTANTNTAYKVEYYLQNLENDEYTLQETANNTGTTDTTANAEIKPFTHFTHAPSATDSGNIAPDGSTVLKVYYTRDKYTVTFDGNGGTLTNGLESQTVKYGGSVIAPVFDRTGYTFVGYDKTNYTNISESFTVTAAWVYYTVSTATNDINAGTFTEYTEQKITVGNIVTLTAVTNEGYTWLGWYEGENKVSQSPTYSFAMTAKDYALTAKWKINQYTLTIVYDNGQEDKVITQDYNTAIESIVNPERKGYGFIGWDKTILTTMPANNMTITAKWQCIFTVSGNVITGLTAYGKANYIVLNIPSVIDGTMMTSINNSAFRDCSFLTSVTIPDSVTTIGDDAFRNCSSLTSVEIGDSVTSIGKRAFYDCNSLTSVVIPDSVTSIGDEAFYNCNSLPSVTIPDSVTSIGSDAFYGCNSLTSVTIPDSVTSIGSDAFYGCNSLTSITVSANNTAYKSIDGNLYGKDGKTLIQYAIGKTATSFTIPDSATKIGDYAFYNCDSLTSVTIGNGVTSIGNYAFESCDSLTSITIPFVGASKNGTSNTHFGYIFGASSYSSNSNNVPISLKKVTITGGTISAYAFYNCNSLTSITIPDSATKIGDYAFYSCDSLTSITIPDSVTLIGNCAFYECNSLTSITIPASVTRIGSYAFFCCNGLTFEDTITWYRTTSYSDWANKTGGIQTSVTASFTFYDNYYWYKL